MRSESGRRAPCSCLPAAAGCSNGWGVGSHTLPDGTCGVWFACIRLRPDARSIYLQDEISRTINRLKRNFSSQGWRWVLRNVDLTMEPGSSLGIVGANGSGKSTMLKILARVMDPTAGSVNVAGRV